MSLYIRVQNSFWTHRKTIRLRSAIGDAALWIMPRLWAYAAENQPDGCFKDYTAHEIAMLLGYTGDAEAMLKAMLQASYMDENPLRIHDWSEHNGYHSMFAERASKAAQARWSKEMSKKNAPDASKETRKERKGKEASISLSNASSIQQALIDVKIDIPSNLDTPSFRVAWENFKAYRTERKEPMTDRAQKAAISKLAKYPVQIAIECIEKSIISNWTGLFPESIKAASPNQPQPRNINHGIAV